MTVSDYLKQNQIEIDSCQLSILIKSLFKVYRRLSLDKSLIIGKDYDPCFPDFFYNSTLVVKAIKKYKSL